MPIEIRELIIKTEISATGRHKQDLNREKNMNILKRQLLDECKRIISVTVKRNNNNKR